MWRGERACGGGERGRVKSNGRGRPGERNGPRDKTETLRLGRKGVETGVGWKGSGLGGRGLSEGNWRSYGDTGRGLSNGSGGMGLRKGPGERFAGGVWRD